MKYRLKDAGMQRKFDRFTGGEFSERLKNDAIDGGDTIAVTCGECVPDLKVSPGLAPARRFVFLFSKDEVEEFSGRPPEEMKAKIKQRIEELRWGLQHFEKSLDDSDESCEVELRWLSAWGTMIAIHNHVQEYVKENEE